MKLPALTKYRCAICDARLREGQYVFSRFTKNRYCCDLDKHTRIIKARKRKRTAA